MFFLQRERNRSGGDDDTASDAGTYIIDDDEETSKDCRLRIDSDDLAGTTADAEVDDVTVPGMCGF